MSCLMSEKEPSQKVQSHPKDFNAYGEGERRFSANLLLRMVKLLEVRRADFFQGFTANDSRVDSPYIIPVSCLSG